MAQKEIIIKICNDNISFNPLLSIPIQHTNIPNTHLSFTTRGDIFWKVEMVEYLTDDKCLKVKVNDYNTKDISSFNTQNPKKEVLQLLFEKFDWEKLEPILTTYKRIKLEEALFNIETKPFSKSEQFDKKIIEDFQNSTSRPGSEYRPHRTKLEDEFSVNFNDLTFMLGYVSFKKHIKPIDKGLSFKILNQHLLAEFENIKFWFAKKLGVKRIKVKFTIISDDNQITETMALSKHIDQITAELIDSIKYQRILALTKKSKISTPDKALFTADELFAQVDSDDIEGNVFNQTEEDILDFFLEKNGVRNKKQLAYLSGKKQSKNHKLRYTLNPNFGFLFLVEGEKNNHFIWELLNSNATYIWSIEKSEKEVEIQFKRIEDIINTVRANGRENYKSAYRNNHQDNDLVFRVISHENIDSNLIDEFPKWKNKLNEQLI